MQRWFRMERPCLGCGRPSSGLCAICRPAAATPLPLRVEASAGGWTLGPYVDELARAVRRAKHHRPAAIRLADALAGPLAAPARPLDLDGVVPVPSPCPRRARRGHQLSAWLADRIAREAGLALHLDALRLRPGPHQASLDARARRRALRGRLRARQAVSGRLLLVDDVLTTGTTAAAAVRELLGAGASAVYVATVCATPSDACTRSVTTSDEQNAGWTVSLV